ncbi:MAG: TetR/AcrR family transcriptional regulator [Candidatus Cybelea sp.]
MVSTLAQRPLRVDPRVTRTRKLIRDALASLLAEKNFESITVQDIAEQATVNRATFYAHFTDKFALLDAMIRDDFSGYLSQGDPLSSPDTRSSLTAVGKNIFAFVGLHRRCKIDRDFEPQLQRSMEAELTDFLSRDFGHCTAMLIASALVGSAMNWRHETPRAPFEPIVANIVRILVDGVERQS